MKILAMEKEIPGITAEMIQPYLKPEASQVWALSQAGIIREIYFREDRHEAVLILECSSLDEAQAALNTLPLVVEGLIAFDVIPLVPYSGIERLFAVEHP